LQARGRARRWCAQDAPRTGACSPHLVSDGLSVACETSCPSGRPAARGFVASGRRRLVGPQDDRASADARGRRARRRSPRRSRGPTGDDAQRPRWQRAEPPCLVDRRLPAATGMVEDMSSLRPGRRAARVAAVGALHAAQNCGVSDRRPQKMSPAGHDPRSRGPRDVRRARGDPVVSACSPRIATARSGCAAPGHRQAGRRQFVSACSSAADGRIGLAVDEGVVHMLRACRFRPARQAGRGPVSGVVLTTSCSRQITGTSSRGRLSARPLRPGRPSHLEIGGASACAPRRRPGKGSCASTSRPPR
jgi:hypothetical protein